MHKGKKWYTRTAEETLEAFKTSRSGLSQNIANQRFERYGPNKLTEASRPAPILRFISQFESAPVLMLIGAIIVLMMLSIMTPETHWADTIVILIVITLNAIMGYIQEEKAAKALHALRKLSSPKVKVQREGRVKTIDPTRVVPGDILYLEEGDKVAADARVVDLVALEIDESLISGESVPVRKVLAPIEDPKAIQSDQLNMVFMGTIVTRGRGHAVVTATGMDSEMGIIASAIQKEEETPLQKKLNILGKQISLMAMLAVTILFAIRMLILPGDLFESFFLSVSLAVAIIPEGLPIVMLVTLAVGMQVMSRRNAIIRKLPAVEALGSTTVICADKTGTLTRNQMTVKEMWVGGRSIQVRGRGYEPKGDILHDGRKMDTTSASFVEALRAMVLCNDSNLVFVDNKWAVIGDPTEGALLVVAGKANMDPRSLLQKMPRAGEKVFDPVRKLMTTIHAGSHRMVAYIKGAPEVMVEMASNIYDGDQIVPLTKERRKEILRLNKGYAKKAYRVLALGTKLLKPDDDAGSDDIEKDMTFIGLIGIVDPVRVDAKSALAQARKAGIKVVMITGDQPDTAKAVAKELGFLKTGRIMTGAQIESLSKNGFRKAIEDVSVFARVSPEHKMMIVRAFKARGHTVAMTGDGVNDAPALKNADIGISMGLSGTDVALEASDMVLTDDNFKSIVGAVEEGRKIYDNIRKFIRYQLSTNVGALFLLFVATLTLPVAIPMYPVQVLWVNIMMDGPPAIALGFETLNPHLMKRRPRPSKESILSSKIMNALIFNGVLMGLISVILFALGINIYGTNVLGIAHSQTLTFTGFVMFQMFNVLNCRSLHRSTFSIGLKSNRLLVYAIVLSILLQIFIVYSPWTQFLFNTVPLNLTDWTLIGILGLFVLLSEEIKKVFMDPNAK